MAEIVKGLFGIDPQGYQEDRLAQQRAEAMQYSKLDPFQKATTAIYQGTQQGVGAGLNMMGVQDPELQAQQIASQLAPNYDMNDPASLQAFQQALQEQAQKTGNGKLSEFSAMVGSKIMQIKSTGAEIGLKQAQAMKALREPNPGIAALIGKSTPESVAAYQQSGNPADLVLADKGLTGTTLDKVSNAKQNMDMLAQTNADIEDWMSKVDPKKPTVTFGLGSSIASGVSSAVSNPTDNALQQASLRRFVDSEVNDLLLAAKGTQTEGDAKRAKERVMTALDKNSNAGVYAALADLKKTKERTIKGLNTYVGSMETKGKGGASEPATLAAPMSGEYKDDYAKYAAKYGNDALPYAAYVAKRKQAK
jgi:hypothetical protein